MTTESNWDASTYDAARRRLVPDFNAFYETAAMLACTTASDTPSVLDLGAGTGILSEFVSARNEDATFTLFDESSAMLDVAKQRLSDRSPLVHVGKFGDALPLGPFDAIISALAIHHLPHAEKSDLIERLSLRLNPGGVFVNADQIAGPTKWHDDFYRLNHERQSRALGTDDKEWAAAVDRMGIDIYASVDWHLNCVSSAGLIHGDCYYKRFGFAVIAAWKPAGQQSVAL